MARTWLITGSSRGLGRALARAVALDGERAAHILRGQQAAVQTKTMTVLPGGKALGENAGHIFRRNADPVVGYFDRDTLVALASDADRYLRFHAITGRAG